VNLRADDWHRLERAFLEGAAANFAPATDHGVTLFDSCVESALASHVDAVQRRQFKAIEARRRNALAAARAGHLHTAQALLDEADAILTSQSTDPRTRIPAQAFLSAVAAYVSYRRSAWDETYSHLRIALERNDELVAQHLSIFEMHRVQIGHNWMRVLARSEELATAVHVGTALIVYLRRQGAHDAWPTDVPWPAPRHHADWQTIPRALVEAMTVQLMSEVAVCLARLDPSRHATLVRPLAEIEPDDPATAADRFLRATVMRAGGNAGDFVEAAAELLAGPPAIGRLLWEALVYEVLRLDGHPRRDHWSSVVRASVTPWTFLPITG
jgi:hypothetical protein